MRRRMVDFLQSAIPGGIADADALRNELFAVIVAREKKRLYRCDDELAKLDELLTTRSAEAAATALATEGTSDAAADAAAGIDG